MVFTMGAPPYVLFARPVFRGRNRKFLPFEPATQRILINIRQLSRLSQDHLDRPGQRQIARGGSVVDMLQR